MHVLKSIFSFLLLSSLVMPNVLHAKPIAVVAQKIKAMKKKRLFPGHYMNMDITSLEGLADIPDAENIRFLRLSGNGITKIPAGIFDSPRFKNLRVLDLGDNKIENGGIERGSFKGLENLRALFLNGNNLMAFEPDTLTDLKGLWFLSIGNNPTDTKKLTDPVTGAKMPQTKVLTDLKKAALAQLPNVIWVYAGAMSRSLLKKIVTASVLLVTAAAVGIIVGLRNRRELAEEKILKEELDILNRKLRATRRSAQKDPDKKDQYQLEIDELQTEINTKEEELRRLEESNRQKDRENLRLKEPQEGEQQNKANAETFKGQILANGTAALDSLRNALAELDIPRTAGAEEAVTDAANNASDQAKYLERQAHILEEILNKNAVKPIRDLAKELKDAVQKATQAVMGND